MEIVTQSHPYQEHQLLNTIPRWLLELNEEFEFYIAGGMITSIFTNKEINDIDIYLHSFDDVIPFLEILLDKCTLLSATNKSCFFRCPENEIMINLIYFDFFKEAKDIFKCFDFTCVMGAYDIRKEEFLFHENFFLHNSQRVLIFNKGTNFPLMSMFRIKKYLDRGYTISKNEHLRMMLRCMTLEINSYEELEDHIGGMYGINLDNALDTSVPFEIDNVIDQISEVIQDFDSGPNTVLDYEDSEVIDNVILLHKLKGEKDIKKIKIDEDKFIFVKNEHYYMKANFKNLYFNNIDDYEKDYFLGYQKGIINKHGHINLRAKEMKSDYYSYGSNFTVNQLYDQEKYKLSIQTKDNLIDNLGRNENNVVGIICKIYKDKIIIDDFNCTTTFFNNKDELSIKFSDVEGYDKKIEKPKEEKKLDYTELKEIKKEIDEKYDERIYKMSNSTRLKKIKEKARKEEEKRKKLIESLPF